MGRSDVHRLNVPEPPARQPTEPSAGSPEDPDEVPAASESVVNVPRNCPRCNSRLTALDIKMNHCFRCNAPLTRPAVPASGQRDQFIVRL